MSLARRNGVHCLPSRTRSGGIIRLFGDAGSTSELAYPFPTFPRNGRYDNTGSLLSAYLAFSQVHPGMLRSRTFVQQDIEMQLGHVFRDNCAYVQIHFMHTGSGDAYTLRFPEGFHIDTVAAFSLQFGDEADAPRILAYCTTDGRTYAANLREYDAHDVTTFNFVSQATIH